MSLSIDVDSSYLKKIKVEQKSWTISLVELKKLWSFLLRETAQTPEYLKTCQTLKCKARRGGLLLGDDHLMREYQKEFRGLSKTTDVLSFPTRESPEYAEPGYLGDLIVSLPMIAKNAKRFGRNFRQELVLVVTHGYLHLIGFEHVKVSPARAKKMKDLQARLSKGFLNSIKTKS